MSYSCTSSKARRSSQLKGLRFYHGRPCKNCNETKRYTSNKSCVVCMILHNANSQERVKQNA